MKKSQAVPATLVMAVAASLAASGCSSSRRECVDNLGLRRPDAECVANGGAYGKNPHWETRRYGSGPVFWPGMGRTFIPSGAARPGGPTISSPGRSSGSSAPSSSVSRGGFGGGGSSFGG